MQKNSGLYPAGARPQISLAPLYQPAAGASIAACTIWQTCRILTARLQQSASYPGGCGGHLWQLVARSAQRVGKPPVSPSAAVSGCPVGRAISPAAPQQIQKTCADGHYLKPQRCGGVKTPPCKARQTLCRRETIGFFDRLRADMESAPTWVCGAAFFLFPGWPLTPAPFAGNGFDRSTGPCPATGCGGMRASRPTAARMVTPFPFGRATAMVL